MESSRSAWPAALEAGLIAVVVLAPLAFGCVEPWSRAALELACFTLALLVFMRGRKAHGAAAEYLWLAPAFLAALGLVQAALPAAADGPWPMLTPFSAAPADGATAARLWGAYAALAFAAPRVLITPAAARRFARAAVISGLLVALLAAAQAATSTDMIYWTRRTLKGVAPFGPYYNKDHAANLLLISLAFAAGLLASGARGWNGGRPERGWLAAQGRLGAAALVIFAALAATRSQGALVALAFGAAAMTALAARFSPSPARRGAIAAGAVGAVGLVVILALRHAGEGADAGGVVEKAVRARLLIYEDLMPWLQQAPVFGTGLGSFGTLYPAFQDASIRAYVVHAHSDWLEIAVETGVVGFAAALAGLLAAAGAGASAWWSARSREMRALIGGGLAAGAFAAAHSLVEFPFMIPANGALAIAVAGFLASAKAWRDKSPGPRAVRPEGSDVFLALAAFVILAGWSSRPLYARASALQAARQGSQLAGAARALDVEETPSRWRGLAQAYYNVANRAEGVDATSLRAALAASLRASAQAPYDARSLDLASACLARLGRPYDALELAQSSRKVAFVPLEPRTGGSRR